MGERANTASTLQAFKAVADNAFTRNILKMLSKNCARDKINRLEVALELYVGVRNDACPSCRLSQVVLTPVLKSACRGFGIPEEELKDRFQDAYWRRALVSVVKGIAWFGVRRPFIPAAPRVFFPHELAMKVGNLLKDDFEQVWRRSELFWQIRDKDRLRANCGSCRFRYVCGGCRARAYSYFRDVLAPDPGCVRNRNAWKIVQLNVEARKRAGSSKIGA